jgi:transposase-like protein
MPVVGLLSGDKVYAVVVPNTNRKTLHAIIYGLVEVGSTVVTDEYPAYLGISKDYIHEVVTHHTKEYANKNGFHTNGIEGFWSQLKRGIRGIYHIFSHKYLQMYCNEFAYRHNTRKIPDAYDLMILLQDSIQTCIILI